MLGVQSGQVPDLRAAELEREVMVSGPGGPFYLTSQMMGIKAALGKLARQERGHGFVGSLTLPCRVHLGAKTILIYLKLQETSEPSRSRVVTGVEGRGPVAANFFSLLHHLTTPNIYDVKATVLVTPFSF